MRVLLSLLVAACLAAHATAAPQADVANSGPVPERAEVTREDVQAEIERVEALPEGDELRGELLSRYTKARNDLGAAAYQADEERRFQARADGAAARLEILGQARAELEAARDPRPLDYVELDPPALEARVAELRLASEEVATALAELEERLRDAEGRGPAIASRKAELDELIEEARGRLDGLPVGVEAQGPLDEALRVALAAELQALEAERSALRVEKATLDARLELLRAETAVARLRATRAKASLLAAETRLNDLRRELAEEARQRAEAERDRLESELFREVAVATLELREQTLTSTATIQLLTDKARQLEADREALEQRFVETRERVEIPSLTEAVGLRLRQERRRLGQIRADVTSVGRRATELELNEGMAGDVLALTPERGHAQAEVLAFGLESRASALAASEGSVERLARQAIQVQERSDSPPARPLTLEEARAIAGRLTEDYASALGDARDAVADEIDCWTELGTQRTRLLSLVEEFESFIAERVLWIRSSEPAWRVRPEHVTAELRDALGEDPLGRFVGAVLDLRSGAPWRIALGLLIVAVLVIARLRLGRVLGEEAELAGQRTQLSIAPTLRALVYSLLMAAPFGVALLVLGWFARLHMVTGEGGLSAESSARALAISEGAGRAAVVAFILSALYVFTGRRGMAAAHFDWAEASTRLVRRTTGWMLFLVPAAVFLSEFLAGLEIIPRSTATSVFTADDEAHAFAEALPRMVFLVAVVATLVGHLRVLHPSRGILAINAKSAVPNDVLTRLRKLWYVLGALLLTLVILATVFGYGFTGRSLFGRLFATFGFIVAVFVVRAVSLRWTKLVRRREAFERLRKRREEARAKRLAEIERRRNAGEDTEELESQGLEVEEETVDVAALSANVLGLVRALTGLAAIAGTFWIWSAVLPALGIFEQVRLWSHEVMVPGAEGASAGIGSEWVTLVDLGGALLILALTWLAVRDLPSLLEIVLLERMDLGSGERYAITTLLRYVLTIVGLFLAFDTLGLSWSKLQWLVAGVSVGLGFGLQEIFANFVSGITLLFERPVRVGDWVTLGDIEGVVSKIRIRATTIRDRDLKELIVPNREFITGRFINWTLSDPVSRVTLDVGIAYGSDTERAISLLIEAGKACPYSVNEPAPSVVFNSFGASSLDFELRVFVSGREIMPSVIHDLHMRVDAAFRAAEIEISFPQQDIHIRTAEGLPDSKAGGGATD